MTDENSIVSYIENYINKFEQEFDIQECGSVIKVSDGIVIISALEEVAIGEMLLFDDGSVAVALDLKESEVGAIILSNGSKILSPESEGICRIKQGDRVKRTGKILQVPTGPALLGRVVDALGNPIDGKGPLKGEIVYREVEAIAPGIIDRQPISETLQTGILSIDALIPIGRGQRELIIGDRQTGKTTIAVDTILNQVNVNEISDKNDHMHSVYVAIGQKKSTVASLVDVLENRGAMKYCTIVSATASENTALQFIAPYVGCAIGEYFRDEGKHALVVYDDLSKHAVAYREISLLLRRPPGREAYPGDIFYLHSRLLERAAKLNDKLKGGSLTALPIIETLAGDISAYIPTNVISITDGQIFLEAELFFKGLRPAVNLGLSVSRVGSAAQKDVIKDLSGSIKLDLAQYREVESFAKFSSDLDSDTRRLIESGKRLMQILKQDQHTPLSLKSEACLLLAVKEGIINKIPEANVFDFCNKLVKNLDQLDLSEKLTVEGILDAKDKEKLEEFLNKMFENYDKSITQEAMAV